MGYQVVGIDNFDDFYPRSLKERNIAGILTSDSFDFHEGNICNPADLDNLASDIDLVIHLVHHLCAHARQLAAPGCER